MVGCARAGACCHGSALQLQSKDASAQLCIGQADPSAALHIPMSASAFRRRLVPVGVITCRMPMTTRMLMYASNGGLSK